MAQIRVNENGVQTLHGRLGDIVFVVSSTGKQYTKRLGKRDLKKKPYSDDELETRRTFKEASDWATAIMADPERRSYFEGLFKMSKKKTFRGYLMSQYSILKKRGQLD